MTHVDSSATTGAIRPIGFASLARKGGRAPETVGDLVRALEAVFPPANAEPWDRTGLLVGDAAEPLAGLAIALDPTPDAIRKARLAGANVLLTHHPVFLDPPEFIGPRTSGASAAGALVFEAVRCGVALANFHTTLDVSAQAQDMLPGMLSLDRVGILEPKAHDGRLGYGQVCMLRAQDRPMTLEAFGLRCTAVFGRAPRIWGPLDKEIVSVATWTGSAGDAAQTCLEKGIDVLVCGEVKYHAALDASSAGVAIVELGHDVSELPFITVLARAAAAAGVAQERIVCLAQDLNWSYPESRRV